MSVKCYVIVGKSDTGELPVSPRIFRRKRFAMHAVLRRAVQAVERATGLQCLSECDVVESFRSDVEWHLYTVSGIFTVEGGEHGTHRLQM